MKHFHLLLIAIYFVACAQKSDLNTEEITTVCNPVDISYRFCIDEPSRREAADPTVILHDNTYFLFASKSGGYWYSDNLSTWTFVETDEIPVEEYAPTAISLNNAVYFLASSTEKSTIYKSEAPKTGKWQIARDSLETAVWDPAFYEDDDGRLYLYWGCSNQHPIYGVELTKSDFSFIDEPKALIYANPNAHGWEVPGDYNTMKGVNPWIEGAWMNKYKGKYYLQYAGPGTEFKSYADGVYESDHPLGPFQLSEHNPFAYKPEGFAAGAGHGSTFKDKFGNYWHIGTISISVKHMFERRLGLYPAFFDDDGVLHAVTKFGDYPMIIPQKKVDNFDEIFPEWMLLSYQKKVTVSSTLDTLIPENMVDEDIRSYWSAKSGNKDEWATIDLGAECDIHAIQVNFAEHHTSIYGRQKNMYHQYIIDYSGDSENWNVLLDRSTNNNDNTHAYFQLPEKVNSRFIRIRNATVPGGNFALSGFRIFGKGKGRMPAEVNQIEGTRNPEDQRSIDLRWNRVQDATGYNIRYGSDRDKLYHNYLVYSDTSLTIHSLNSNWNYYFAVDAFNENGITEGTIILEK